MSSDESDELPPFTYRQPRIDGVEDVEGYVPGGYHPVHIGDTLGADGKYYKVIHKLGSGGFSTVWLVRSLQGDESCFALKILRADADIMEVTILKHLSKVSGPGHPNVAMLLDSFKVTGPNGDHHCLILPFLGPSLHTIKAMSALSGPVRQSVCQQIASAVAFLHGHGICHGDLTASNIVFDLPSTTGTASPTIGQLLGPIVSESLKLPGGTRSPHGPRRVVQNPTLDGIDFQSIWSVRIIDFSESFFSRQPPSSLGSPIDFFPPELCFGYSPSEQTDIWQLACVLYQVHAQTHLFPVFLRIFEALVGTVVSYLGPLPESWRNKFDFEDYGYRESGELPTKEEPVYWFETKPIKKSLEERISPRATHLSASEKGDLIQLLREMLAYNPQDRLSAVDVSRRLRPAGQPPGPLPCPLNRD